MKYALTIIIVLSQFGLLAATVIHVPGDQPTIQAGINAASPGDTVLVACDTYYEHDILIDKSLTLISESGDPSCVTIDGEELGSVLIAENCGSYSLIGLRITGGEPRDEYGYLGIGGGLAAVLGVGPLLVEDCVFENNRADEGGGVFTLGANVFRSCSFISNEGGGVFYDICSVDGALFENCYFEGNTRDWGNWGGGAISFHQDMWWSSYITITDCFFYNNSASPGGAVDLHEADGLITGSTFVGNSSRWGGAVNCYHGALGIVNCTFTWNQATESGGALACWSGGMNLQDCILWEDSHPEIFVDGGGVTATCSDIQGGWPGTGNIDEVPSFCDPHGGLFSIAANSPCAPANNDCGVLMGAWPVGCTTGTRATSWSELKSLY